MRTNGDIATPYDPRRPRISVQIQASITTNLQFSDLSLIQVHDREPSQVYRGRNVAHMMMPHSLDDLAALPTEADRAKARGFIDRCAINILAGLPLRELDAVSRIVPLSDAEKGLVASWSSPETWQAGARHPGRGKYLIKTGQRVGIPVDLEYVGDEAALYNTDLGPGQF